MRVLVAWILLGPALARHLHAADLWVVAERPAERGLAAYAQEVAALQARAVRSRATWSEVDLREKVAKKHLDLVRRYERVPDDRERARLLGELALVHAELAWSERIAPLAEAVARLDPEGAERLGHFAESEHFFARVVGVGAAYAEAAVRLAEAAHEGFRELFGVESISKVPGKKIRILIHRDESHTRPRLYFHPTPALHSELRYEIPDEKYLTLAGRQRVVYGFCHELGHMVAMWGEFGKVEDDKHAWAHYTGCLVVEHVYDKLGNEPWPSWSAFQRRASGRARLDKELEGRTPDRSSYEGTLALFDAVGRTCGPEVYGKAFALLAEKRRFRLVNRVRYLWLDDLRDALLATVEKDKRNELASLFAR